MEEVNIYLLDTILNKPEFLPMENIKIIRDKKTLFDLISRFLIEYDRVNVIYDDIYTVFMVQIVSSVPEYLLDSIRVYRTVDFPYNNFHYIYYK